MLTPLFYLLLSITFLLVCLISFIRTYRAQSWGWFVKVFAQMFIYYGVYLLPFLLIWSVEFYRLGRISTLEFTAWLALMALYVYARLLEPNMLKVNYNKIRLGSEPLTKPLNVALLADIHVGLFSGGPRHLQRIVDKLNAMPDIDAVVFSGDWTYEPGNYLVRQMAPLSNIKHPCYHVLGNHDEQFPGPDITAELLEALDTLGIQNIEADCVDLGSVNLVGVGDLWASKAEFQHFEPNALNTKPSVVLAHNPDTVEYIPDGLFSQRPLMLSGHTHGGQVHIPFVMRAIFNKHSATGYIEGLYQHNKAQVFVTAGIGMVFLPFRINMPPRIDILKLR